MLISLRELQRQPLIDTLVVHSLDLMLYQVSVVLDGRELYVTDNQGKLLRSHNLVSIQALFEGWPVAEMRLRQSSAYDEMIGQPLRETNQLDVPLGRNRVGEPLQVAAVPTRH
ncbi:DUF6482 family protein [Parathalassolituus penaei]|uniref:DUF6482 family protein n=1 Tax=Parathalassolituus penaei TaxID=2997323 RepID=A0A9X3EM32_9GAMM|nr:DUF6482 family protein [Parathalassolituus penaei]MCY0966871.1 DUF6482 family protein [Parathalassolituus penaei]